MSHFVVLVIGGDVEGQLAPFDENLRVEEYENYLTDEDVTRMKEYYEKQGEDVSTTEKLLKFMPEWNGGEGGVSEDGRLFYLSTYNPNSKWDWYQIGGRWSGYFRLKDGAAGILGEESAIATLDPDHVSPDGEKFADIVLKRDIDFESERTAARVRAEKLFDEWEKITNGVTVPTWASIRDKHPDNIDAARDEYHSIPVIKELMKNRLVGFFEDPAEVFGVGREAYIQSEVDSIYVPYSILKDGKWYAKGEMGWWGMSTDDMTQAEWNANVRKMFDELPDDTVITVVDCHI